MITIRKLGQADSDILRDIRLRSLREEPQWFTANVAEEESMTALAWRRAAAETTRNVIVGAFDGTSIVGIIGGRQWQDDPQTAYWRATWVDRPYRKRGVARKLCAALNEWTEARDYTRAILNVRADNTGGLALFESVGARRYMEEPLLFSDGKLAKAVWFQKTFG